MCTKKKSKGFSLIFIGLLMVVFPHFLELFTSLQISELLKTSLKLVGIFFEIIGLILINKERKQVKEQ